MTLEQSIEDLERDYKLLSAELEHLKAQINYVKWEYWERNEYNEVKAQYIDVIRNARERLLAIQEEMAKK